jgi:valyl-tRNA synthetase
VTIKPADPAAERRIADAVHLIAPLARARVEVVPGAERPRHAAVAVTPDAEVYVQLEGIVDLAAERHRLRREIERAAREVAGLEAKLGRPEFVERAPAEVVARERARLAEQQALRTKLTASLEALE